MLAGTPFIVPAQAPAQNQSSGITRVAAAASPVETLTQTLKRKVVEEAVGTLLNNQLPLKLDASTLHSTVAELPGAPFQPLPLKLTAQAMNEPLPPGDYVMRALAFCTEYSVHRPGNGVPYQTGPIQGKCADAIATLLWRGTIEKRRKPRELQTVSWAIQSGVTYAQMPKTYQAVIDDVIPEFRSQLSGDFVQSLEDLYVARAKDAGLPPLDKFLTSLGKPGELVLSAHQQRKALLRQNTNDQLRDQMLFVGQETKVAPEKANLGPWMERIPGVAYVRYRIVGGNLKSNNEVHVRILPRAAERVGAINSPHSHFAAYRPTSAREVAAVAPPKTSATAGLSPLDLLRGTMAYSISRATQALSIVPEPAPDDKHPSPVVGTVSELKGSATITHEGSTTPLTDADEIQIGDTLTTGPNSRFQITFADGTTFTLAEKTTIVVDKYFYSPAQPEAGTSAYSWLQGQFVYVSGLLGKEDPAATPTWVNTEYGDIGIRGTEFSGQLRGRIGTAEIQLISGSLALKPRRSSRTTVVTGPIIAFMNATTVRTAPLTREHYDATRKRLLLMESAPPEIRR